MVLFANRAVWRQGAAAAAKPASPKSLFARLSVYLTSVVAIAIVALASFDRVAALLATNLGAAIGRVEIEEPIIARPWRVAAVEAIENAGDPPSEHLRPSRPSSTDRDQMAKAGDDADAMSLERIGWRDADESGEPALAESGAKSGKSVWRTVCVRMCDGYFFPVSFATTREHFARDEARCKASCGSPARLFVSPGHDGTTSNLRDLRGRPYADLVGERGRSSVAVSPSCSCRAQPWEEASRKRHELYAALDHAKKSGVSFETVHPGARVAGTVATGPGGGPAAIQIEVERPRLDRPLLSAEAQAAAKDGRLVNPAAKASRAKGKASSKDKEKAKHANRKPVSGWTALMGLGAGTLKSADLAYLRAPRPTTAHEDFRRTFFGAF